MHKGAKQSYRHEMFSLERKSAVTYEPLILLHMRAQKPSVTCGGQKPLAKPINFLNIPPIMSLELIHITLTRETARIIN
jgi:hypothetical protein